MDRSFVFVILAGLGIGLLWPQGDEGAEPAAAAAIVADPSAEVLLEKRGAHFYADVAINGRPLRMMVDTGATMVAIGVDDAERLGIKFDPAEFEPIARTANGEARGTRVVFDTVAIDGKKVSKVRGAIIEGLDMPLLGQAYLGRVGTVEMAGDYMRLR